MTVKDLIRPIPGVRQASLLRQRIAFNSSAHYWDRHYLRGGTSGDGSHGALAAAKADFLNKFVAANRISSVTEFGCGEGYQLSLADYPYYIGLDVSRTIIKVCKQRFADDQTKSFFLYDGFCFVDHAGLFRSDLAISLDVIYHLVEDNVYEIYMRHLFASGGRYVIIYATDQEMAGTAPHVRHRRFSSWVEGHYPAWRLMEISPGPNSGPARANFFVYQYTPRT